MMRLFERAVRARTRSTTTPSSSPTTTSRSRSRRRGCRCSGANHLDGRRGAERLVAHELAHQWFGNSLTIGALARHLAARGLRLLRRVAVVGARPAARRPTSSRAGLRAAWRRCRRTSSLGDPGPALMFDDRRLQARRADPARAAPDRRRRNVLRHPSGPGPAPTPTATSSPTTSSTSRPGTATYRCASSSTPGCAGRRCRTCRSSGRRSWCPPPLGPRSSRTTAPAASRVAVCAAL